MGIADANEIVPDYSVVFYRCGPQWKRGLPLGEQHAIHDHIAYLQRLVAQRLISQAGPFYQITDKIRGGLVGLVIFAVGVDEATGLADNDPAVQAQIMEYESLPWYP